MDIIVLNKNYQYWCEVGLRKVVKWLVLQKIEVVEVHDTLEIRALNMRMPMIVRLLDFVGYRARREDIHFTENAVYDRDDNTCQYWHVDENGQKHKYRCTVHDRTIDHVVPRSQGGSNSFENCVCACRRCNTEIKKNRKPQDAGIELIREPFVPKRRKGEMVLARFVYDQRKLSHRIFAEKYQTRSARLALETALGPALIEQPA
jgi:5-methylcytosine-specific restriction endonuclease McrA